jgi:hypothetical protein
MRRNTIVSLTLAAAATMAFAATSVLGSGAPKVDVRPSYATVEVTMQPERGPALSRPAGRKPVSNKPKVVYLSGEGTVNTDPAAGGTGPYIDFKLTAPKNLCPRVINGGINPGSLDLFQQGSFVHKGDYHVLMGLDDGAAGTPTSFPYESQVICLKGVR